MTQLQKIVTFKWLQVVKINSLNVKFLWFPLVVYVKQVYLLSTQINQQLIAISTER